MSQDDLHQIPRLRWPGRITAMISTHPWKSLMLAAMSCLICIAITLPGLEFKSDRSDLISPNASFHQRWLEYCERFRETNELLILLEGENKTELAQAQQWIVRELKARPELFGDILSQSMVMAQADQQSLSQSFDPERLKADLQIAMMVQAASQQTSPLIALVGVAQQELQPQGKDESSELPVTNRIAHALEESLQAIDTSYQKYFPESSPAPTRLWNQYLLASQDSKPTNRELISVVPLTGTETGSAKYQKSLEEINRLLQAAQQRFPSIYCGLTGIPELEHEEMARSQSDMGIASAVSFGGVVILLMYGFHGLRLPIACCVTLGISMLWTLGLTTVLIGHLNILSMAFAAILVGLGIDFGIHLLSSYLDYREKNVSVVRSISLASDTVGKGIITAAVTTSIAFLCAGVTDFPGVAELGIIAGCGVLLAVLATFLVFPCLITLAERESENRMILSLSNRQKRNVFSCNWLRTLVSQQPLLTAVLFLVPVLVLSAQGWEIDKTTIRSRVVYDANLLNMQPDNLPAVETQQKLLSGSQGDVLYAVAWYPSREEAIEQANRFRNLPSVSNVMELASHQLSGGTEEVFQQFSQLLEISSQISTAPKHTLPHNPAETGQALEKLLEQLGNNSSIAATQIRLQLDHFLDYYSRQPFEVQIQILASVEQELIRSLWSEIRMQAADLSGLLNQQHEISQILQSRFRNKQGDWLLQIYPRGDIWSDEPLEKFVTDLRSVDARVTGTPLQNYEASRQLKQSYTDAAIYAALAIVLVLLLDVTKIKTTLLAWTIPIPVLALIILLSDSRGTIEWQSLSMIQLSAAYVASVTLICLLIEKRECLVGLLAILPPALGACMLLGMMALFHIPFTPANLIALPLVLGIGIDDGVHVVHDFRRSKNKYLMSANTWRALVLTSFTSMIGFGSLSLASHKGLAGLGTVVMIGIASCLLVSIILLPAVLSLIANPVREQEQAHSSLEQRSCIAA